MQQLEKENHLQLQLYQIKYKEPLGQPSKQNHYQKIHEEAFFNNIIDSSQNLLVLKLKIYKQNLNEEKVIQLINKLQRFSSNLIELKLNLQQNFFSEAGAQKLSDLLSNCQNLIKLNLNCSDTQIGPDGGFILEQGYQNCNKLEYLKIDMSNNYYYKEEFDDQTQSDLLVGSQLHKLKNLQTFCLEYQWNKIKQQGFKVLGEGLSKCNLLSLSLNLRHTDADSEAIYDIFEGINQNKNLQCLFLNFESYEQISEDCFLFIAESILQLQQLVQLSIISQKFDEEIIFKFYLITLKLKRLVKIKVE